MSKMTDTTPIESLLLLTLPDALLVIDHSGRIIHANTLAARLFDYPPAELTGQAFAALLPERWHQTYQRYLAECLNDSCLRGMDPAPVLDVLRRDGAELAAEILFRPLPTEKDLHLLVVIRDVSEQRRLRQALERATAELEREAQRRHKELLRVNAELREREAQYRQLVENQPDLICRFLPDTRLTFVNAAYARFFNTTPEELIGKPFIDFLSPSEQAEVWEQLAAFNPAAPARQYEHKTTRFDGVDRWHLWNEFAFFDRQGKAIGFQSVGVDITGRKQAEEGLRDAHRFYQQIIASAQDGILVTDAAGTFTLWNPAMERMSGLAAEEILGKTAKALFPFLEEQAIYPLFERALAGETTTTPDYYYYPPGAPRAIWANNEYIPLRDSEGRVIGVIGTVSDITERKHAEEALRKSEERLKLALRAARAGAWEWSAATNRAIWSDDNYRVLGLEPGSVDACYENWLRRVHPDDRAAAERQVADAMEQGVDLNIEFRVLGASGDVRWLNDIGKMVFDSAGKPVGMYGIQIDVTDRKQATEALREREEQYRLLVENQTDLLVKVDTEGRFLFVSPSYCATFGKSSDELLGKPFFPLIHANDVSAAMEAIEALHQPPHSVYLEQRAMTKDGWRWFGWGDKSVLNEQGQVVAIIGVGRDITDRKRAEEALFQEKERALVTLHSIGDAVITTDAHAVVDYLNPVAEALTGWSMADALGRPLEEVFRIVNEQSREPAPDPVARCLEEGKIVGLANHSILVSRTGREYHIDDSAAPIRGRDGQVLGAVLVFHDVTETRQLARQLEYDATHDALTGLTNRPEFERRLARALASAQQYGAQHALCYLDLDQFKIVNDTAGHAAGDELLRQIRTILSGMFRERDTLARIGGDEFGLLLNNCPLERAQRIAQNVVTNIRDHRFSWEGRTYQIGVSIGLVSVTAESQDTAQLLAQADVACYIAKETGRSRVHLYRREDSDTVQRHAEILGVAGLRDSLEQGQFRLHYQPIVPLNGLNAPPCRYEVLLRVVSPGGPGVDTELVLPAAFIPAAERYGLMGAIDRWVIQTAFAEYASGVGQTGAQIAINLSGNSLSDETLLAFIEAQFTAQQFPPDRVCFEITETSAIQHLGRAQELMAALKRRGSQLALDDFGSGLSSFHYLKTLPIDYLKIDGSFVKDMARNPKDRALVAAINQMSHALGIQTVAEYVEDQAIAECLHTLGVDYAQGFFFGRPSPWAEPR